MIRPFGGLGSSFLSLGGALPGFGSSFPGLGQIGEHPAHLVFECRDMRRVRLEVAAVHVEADR